MAPVKPIISSNVSPTPGVTLITKNTNLVSRCSSIPRKLNIQTTFLAQKHTLPLSTSLRLFPQFRCGYILKPKLITSVASASGIDVAVEDADVSQSTDTAEAISGESTESESSTVQEITPVKSNRTRPVRRSEMPPVKNEELVIGATFKGKVRSIQPFGAFVDFGAFTDGLVHVSRLSDSFVKDVANIVTVGQEVTVRLMEANMETGRISLSMRESDDPSNPQTQRDAPSSGDKSRPPRKYNQKRDETKKSSKFVKGQDLEGTVKNLTRSGAFISLPEGEEGFLPQSEEADEGLVNIMGDSSLEVGQEVSVRVLRIARGQVTLTMKKEEDAEKLDAKLVLGEVPKATNPFVLAFRSNQAITAFLEEREKESKEAEDVSNGGKDGIVVGKDEENLENKEAELSGEVAEIDSGIVEEAKENGASSELSAGHSFSDETEKNVEQLISGELTDQTSPDIVEKNVEPLISGELTDQASSDIVEQTTEMSADSILGNNEDLSEKMETTELSVTQDENETAALDPDNNGSIDSSGAQITSVDPEAISTESPVGGDVENLADIVLTEVEKQTSTDPQKNGNISSPSEPNGYASPEETTTKAAIPPALVKQLRDETGAGMMDCKKALSETEGDIVKAQEYLRTKGLASADKKASRATAEGRIGSYIHDSRIGVLIEVNCETDFVARGDIFKELVDDLAMQVAACPQTQYLITEDVPKEIVDKERELEMQKEDLLSKPEQFRSKIVDGRIRKRLEELALLEQPFIKDDKVIVKDWVKQTISTIGENIKVKRFVRYNLGEGLEKRSQDFAAEVAAQTQTTSKPISAPAADTKETTETTPPEVIVSAALVKQLRDETGAGMMDCKKALSETGGDLDKAQEYLRKKGLSSAEKKSSRLAAEGRIGSYIHDSRIGVLIEVNCETDFVGRSQKFKELVDDLAMQVVACPQVQYVSVEDIPENIVRKERELEMNREDLQSKPESIREKIVDGRVTKRLGELALLEQEFIKNDGVIVKDLVKQSVAAIGENIKVRRFVRFTLGEKVNGESESEAGEVD